MGKPGKTAPREDQSGTPPHGDTLREPDERTRQGRPREVSEQPNTNQETGRSEPNENVETGRSTTRTSEESI